MLRVFISASLTAVDRKCGNAGPGDQDRLCRRFIWTACKSLSAKSCTFTASGSPCGRHSRPLFLKHPTSSFFLVSTEITGSPAARNAETCRAIASNWPSRSGCALPSRVGIALKAVAKRGQQRPDAPIADRIAKLAQGAREVPVLFETQRNGRSGSPRSTGSTRLQGRQQTRLFFRRRLAPTATPTNPVHRRRRVASVKLCKATANRRGRYPGDLAHQRDTAPARCPRLGRRKKPTTPLVEIRNKIRGGFYRPMAVHKARVGIRNGKIIAWDHRVAAKPIIKGTPLAAGIMPDPNGVDPLSVEGLADSRYAIPAFSVGLTDANSQVPVLWWRSVGHTHTAYAMETLIDMVASATGRILTTCDSIFSREMARTKNALKRF